MKKIFTWTLKVGLIFVAASVLTYTLHYVIFRDLHHIFIYMIGDFGFLFIDVLLVVLLIERVLARKEKQALIKKLNMVIGSFFSEVGLKLLKKFNTFVENSESLADKLKVTDEWGNKDFDRAITEAKKFKYNMNMDKEKLCELRDYLVSKRPFLLRLLENPYLLEHDDFTDLLWAVFHLSEELEFRGYKLKSLPDEDYKHLANDLKRAYSQITIAWISYMKHMKKSYPFLFSLASRVNPMDPKASPVITD
ncbi:MAG: hypothetical protein ACOC5G_04235 [Acidobacteriota bacterium]